jgi:hypothetical protein
MSKQEDAKLILELYNLRREPVMREARTWFFTFNPTSAKDVTDALFSDKSGYYRMVVSYWDMAASLVNNGAIDEQLFNDANGEHLFVFAKIQNVLPELRAAFNAPEMLAHFEKLVMRIPDAQKTLDGLRERIKQISATMSEQQAAKAQAAS